MFCSKAVRAEVGEKMISFRVRINSSDVKLKETNAPKNMFE